MITADAAFTLREGTKTTLDSSVELYVAMKVDVEAETFTAYVAAMYQGTQVDGQIFQFSKADVEANGGSGSTELEKVMDAFDRTVKSEISGFSENSGVTFTVS